MGLSAGMVANPIPADALPVTSNLAVPPAGASTFVYAPNGATPGAAAYRVSNGLSTPVTITAIFNDPSGVYARVNANVAAAFGPSLTGGFGEVLAPFSQGSSVRTTSGSPVRSANPPPKPGGSPGPLMNYVGSGWVWPLADLFPTEGAFVYYLKALGYDASGLNVLSAENMEAVRNFQSDHYPTHIDGLIGLQTISALHGPVVELLQGGLPRYVPKTSGASRRRSSGATRNPADPWDASTWEWLPATFFDGPPTTTTRRWIKLVAVDTPSPTPPSLPGPGKPPSPSGWYGHGGDYVAKLMKNFGATQEDVIAVIRTRPRPGGGTEMQAAVVRHLPRSSGASRRRSSGASRNAMRGGGGSFAGGGGLRQSNPCGCTAKAENPDDCTVVYENGQALLCCGPSATCARLPILSPQDVDLLLAELPIGTYRPLARLSRRARKAVERAAAYAHGAGDVLSGRQRNQVHHGNSGTDFGTVARRSQLLAECADVLSGRMQNQAHHGKTGHDFGTVERRRSNPDASVNACFIDLSALRLHCPGSPLHGVVVTDVEEIGQTGSGEGTVVMASYIDPTTGVETIDAVVVMADQGVPWWESDGHCCESCALGEGCTDCEAA
jgi:hypothetical protein